MHVYIYIHIRDVTDALSVLGVPTSHVVSRVAHCLARSVCGGIQSSRGGGGGAWVCRVSFRGLDEKLRRFIAHPLSIQCTANGLRGPYTSLGLLTAYPKARMYFLFGQYIMITKIIITKKKIGHNRKRTTLEPVGIWPLFYGSFAPYGPEPLWESQRFFWRSCCDG